MRTLLLASIVVPLLACSVAHAPNTPDSRSNWLHACDADTDCADADTCACGVCTKPCGATSQCGNESEGVECQAVVSQALHAQCSANDSAGLTSICIQGCQFTSDCSGLGDDFQCHRGLCVTSVDAEIRDGGNDSAADSSMPTEGPISEITPGVVGCGTDIPACQAPTIKCCSSSGNGGGCAPLSGVCSSDISLECDGPEDCASGVCSGEPWGNGAMTQCLPERGTYLMCHDHTQCPSETPNCCPIYTAQFLPHLGQCDTRTVLTTGACDVPQDR